MEYKEYFTLSNKYEEALRNYIITNKGDFNDSYYQAKVFLSRMNTQAYRDKKFCKSAGKWLKNRDTLRLMKIFRDTGYDTDNIVHFNACALMDSTFIR